MRVAIYTVYAGENEAQVYDVTGFRDIEDFMDVVATDGVWLTLSDFGVSYRVENIVKIVEVEPS